MDTTEDLIRRVQYTQKWTDIRQAAEEVVAGNTPEDSRRMAKALFAAKEHQARELATFILGHLASTSSESLQFLRSCVSRDEDLNIFMRS